MTFNVKQYKKLAFSSDLDLKNLIFNFRFDLI
jgi:hypothetical protein